MTIVELSNVAVKVKHELSEEPLSTDEQMKALEIIESLKSDLKKNVSQEASSTLGLFKSWHIC